MLTIPSLKCPKCAHEWTPRVANPRVCPRCRRYLAVEANGHEAGKARPKRCTR